MTPAYRKHARGALLGVGLTVASLLLPGACSWRIGWPRHEVRVVAQATDTSSDAMHARVGTNIVEITRAYIVWSAVELEPCGQRPTLPGFPVARILHPPLAHAHGPTTPTRLGQQLALALHQPTSVRTIGELEPPPGDYCGLRVDIAPADDDAPHAPADGALTGASMLIEGRWRPHAEAPWRPMTLRTSARLDLRLRPPQGQVWRFGDDEAQLGRVEIRTGGPARWLARVQLDGTDEVTQANQTLRGIREATRVELLGVTAKATP